MTGPASDGLPPAVAALVALIRHAGDAPLPDAPSAAAGRDTVLGLPVLRWLLSCCSPADGRAGLLLDRIAALHAGPGAGGAIPAETWRSLRLEVLEEVDGAEGEQRALAQVAEAAAWPIEGASSLLVDVFRAVLALQQQRRLAELGWTRADQQSAEAHLSAIHAELAQEGTPVDRRRIPAIFSARQPELERRFVEQLEAANAAYAALSHTALAQVRAALEASG
jgi:hypothetical protein